MLRIFLKGKITDEEIDAAAKYVKGL